MDAIFKNPVKFFRQSDADFFTSTPSAPLALTSRLTPFLENKTFVQHFKDIIEYRTMDYYSRRYKELSITTPQTQYKIPKEKDLKVADIGIK